jgi:predicted GTPase
VSRWRIAVVVVLLVLPLGFLALTGSYYLWQSGLGFKVWWGMAASMALGYGLAWYWHHKQQLLRPVDFTPPVTWTERDRQAWQLVEARAKEAPRLSADQLASLDTYLNAGKELAQELAHFYHPGTRDPVGALTLPEILAVTELAAHDLAELVDQYVPGGHLLTVRNWQQARQAADWYRTANNVYWAIAALFSPIKTGLRYAAAQVGLSTPFQQLQQNLLVWFYTAFLHRVGTYLIDLDSGRMRIGARRYRELVRAEAGDSSPAADGKPMVPPESAVEPARTVTITVMGQVKAGKSSFINAFLGERKAQTDVLPATATIARYELQPRGIGSRLVLLDTVGYAHSGPAADQLRATQEAAQQSDLLLLVMHARNPARQADAAALEGLQRWFAARPDLKLPPILGVVTHIDLLSPALEWAPPYNWQQPTRPKEGQIQAALTALRDQMGKYLVGAVPVCTAEGKVYGVEEWFLPTLAELLDEAHAVGLLRCLRAEADAGKVRKVLQQLLTVGKQVLLTLWVPPEASGAASRFGRSPPASASPRSPEASR